MSRIAVPRGWQKVIDGVAVPGDLAWSEISRNFSPVIRLLGHSHENFWCLVRRAEKASRPAKGCVVSQEGIER